MTEENKTPEPVPEVTEKKKNVEVVRGKRHGRKRSASTPTWMKTQNAIAGRSRNRRAREEQKKQEQAQKKAEKKYQNSNKKFCPKCSNLQEYVNNDAGQMVCSVCGFNPTEA